MLGGSKGIRDLIDEAKPGSTIGNVCWGWEIEDGIQGTSCMVKHFEG